MKRFTSIPHLAGLGSALAVAAAAPTIAQEPQESACQVQAAAAFGDYGLSDEGIAAVVNNDVITKYDVRQRMRLILMQTGVRITPEILDQVEQRALDLLIEESLKMQQAAEFELEIPPAEVIAEFENLAQLNQVSVDEICASLAEFGIDPSTLEDQLRAEIAWQIMVSGRYRDSVRVSNHQIDQVLTRLAENSTEPQYQISEILLTPPPGANDADVEAGIQDIFQQLENGASFPAIARQYSSAASAINFGDVGWVRSGELRPEIEAVVSQMEVGSVSEPIHTTDGIYLIALRDKAEALDPERVSLVQALVLIPEGAGEDVVAQLDRDFRRAMRGVDNCDDFQSVSGDALDVQVANLGFVSPRNLAAPFRAAVETMSAGDVSAPIRHQNNLVTLGLCERSLTAGADLPSREQIESRLIEQQLSLIQRRWIRDLRRDAMVDIRLDR